MPKIAAPGAARRRPLRTAARKCPQAVFLPVDHDEYKRVSLLFKAELAKVSPLMQDVGIGRVVAFAQALGVGVAAQHEVARVAGGPHTGEEQVVAPDHGDAAGELAARLGVAGHQLLARVEIEHIPVVGEVALLAHAVEAHNFPVLQLRVEAVVLVFVVARLGLCKRGIELRRAGLELALAVLDHPLQVVVGRDVLGQFRDAQVGVNQRECARREGQLDFAKYDLFLAKQVAHFLGQLDTYKDRNGSVLDNTIVMRVEFPDFKGPLVGRLYFRGTSYDVYDGRSWSNTLRGQHPLTRSSGGEFNVSGGQRADARPTRLSCPWGSCRLQKVS